MRLRHRYTFYQMEPHVSPESMHAVLRLLRFIPCIFRMHRNRQFPRRRDPFQFDLQVERNEVGHEGRGEKADPLPGLNGSNRLVCPLFYLHHAADDAPGLFVRMGKQRGQFALRPGESHLWSYAPKHFLID